ncbi:MAG: polysaccharide deacetylase family protein [Desulfuromonadales bacterium]
MDFSRLHELPVPGSARTAYRRLRGLYRGARAVKNRLLNAIDRPVVVLVYHRVVELAEDPEAIAVSPGNFRRQMEYLKRHFPVLRLEEDWDKIAEPSVVVTFDDGYADNAQTALPVLEEVRAPATFFVSTGLIGADQVFWWHRLEALLLGEGEFPSRFELQDRRFDRAWQTTTREQRKILYASLAMLMRRLDPARQRDWLEQLEQWAGPGAAPTGLHRLMTREEVRVLAESPWATIGAHTVSHSALSALTAAQQREEIFTSKATLERIIGKEITTFSYPFGRQSEYNRTSLDLCREAGFTKAAANFPGQVHRWTDPLQLPRHLVRNWDLETFAAEMKGFWTR